MHTATVSAKGWVVIPKSLREKHGLRKGSRVQVLDYGQILALVPLPADPIEALHGMFVGGAPLTEDLLAEHASEGCGGTREVAYIVQRRWGMERLQAALAMLEATAIEVVPVDRDLALMAAHIKAQHPVAYADAFAAALAQANEATLVTGDPEFELLEGTLDIHWLPRRAG